MPTKCELCDRKAEFIENVPDHGPTGYRTRFFCHAHKPEVQAPVKPTHDGWHTMLVPIPGADVMEQVRIKHSHGDPSKTMIGPLSPLVAEYYEVKEFLVPHLVRKKATSDQSPAPAAPPVN